MINNDMCSVYVVGNVNEKEVTSLIENSFSLSSTTFDFNHNVNTDCTDQSTETIIEKIPLTKLN